MSALSQQITESVQAGFSGIWLRTYEYDAARREIEKVMSELDWTSMYWDGTRGLQIAGIENESLGKKDPLNAADPRNAKNFSAAVSVLLDSASVGGELGDNSAILIVPNLHLYVTTHKLAELQTLQNAIIDGAAVRRHIVGLVPPTAEIPVEIEKQMLLMDHELPTVEELDVILTDIIEETNRDEDSIDDIVDDESVLMSGEDEDDPIANAFAPVPMPTGEERRQILHAAGGLTRMEFTNAVALSIVRTNSVSAGVMWEMKEQALLSSGLLTLHKGEDGFDTLGGMPILKKHAIQMINSPNVDEDVRARGMVLLGVGGVGKSEFAKRLGNEVGRPMLWLDVGKLMGSLVGQTDERTRTALRLVERMAPCIFFIDEIEKALAGAQGANDSGVSGRMLGSLLTWLNDHKSDVFTIVTSNDISRLPSPLTRAERFDGIYFLDFPEAEGRDAIWSIYRSKFNIDEADEKPEDHLWTGAEIRACCRTARLRDISLVEASKSIVPVHKVGREEIDKMRTWAAGRCLSADKEGGFEGKPLLSQAANKSTKTRARGRRKISTRSAS